MSLQQDFSDTITALREKRPLVHCITNYVTAGDTANMLLAAGASPIMADDPAEAAEIASQADALLLNMGTLSERHVSAMLKAGAAANRKNIPVILDPVGIHISEFRKASAQKIFSEVRITAVRGNVSELAFLGGNMSALSSGVDCRDDGEDAFSAVSSAARKYNCVCCATGKTDFITDGEKDISLLNGCAALKRVTGAGCMTTALIAAFAAVCEPFSAAVFGTAFMGICGEHSEYSPPCRYMGSFRAGLFDKAGMSAEEISSRIRSE